MVSSMYSASPMAFVDIALIPARGGSKGLSNKNLLEIKGRTLLQRVIDSAINSNKFSEIYVSSENHEILSLARTTGVSVLERAVEAATDSATADDVVSDFLSKLKVREVDRVRLTYLQPTSPFRTSDHINGALDVANTHESRSCVSICKVSQHPEKMLRIASGSLESYSTSHIQNLSANRQALPTIYLPNGAIYVFPVPRFQKIQTFPIKGSGYIEMDAVSSVDIDSAIDLTLARALGL